MDRRLRRRPDDPRVRDQRHAASRPSRGDLQCVARAAAGRGNRDRRAARRPLHQRVATLGAKAWTRTGLGSGGWRPSAGRASMDPGCSGTPWPCRRPMRDRAVVAALRRSPRASAWPGRRDPANVPALCRSASCRVRGDADARLVPAHRADDRGVRTDPGQPALSVVLPQPGQCHPCISPLPCHPRCGSRRHRGRRAGHPRMEARQTAPRPRR